MKTYDTDFAAWSAAQAAALRRRASNEIDWENVAEEIETLGRSDRREIRSRLAILCEHLLKWQFQPAGRSPSWTRSIMDNRNAIADLIEESPSLAVYLAAHLAWAYARGREAAVKETGIVDLPETCPWTIEQVLAPDFWSYQRGPD